MQIQGKIAVVTGAGSGLGWATCQVLRGAGAVVWGLERDASRLQPLRDSHPLGIHALQADVGDRMVLFPKRTGRPEEFGRLVRHVVENEYLNATTLDLDAGTRTTPR